MDKKMKNNSVIARSCNEIEATKQSRYWIIIFCLFILIVNISVFCKDNLALNENAIKDSLSFLAKKQLGNGSWDKENDLSVPFVLLVFLGNGHFPGKGEYGEIVKKGINYITNNITENGYINISSDKSLRVHSLAALVLIESFGSMKNKELYKKMDKVINFIVNNQTKRGGWFYKLSQDDEEVATTAYQLIALIEAKESGFSVPAEAIEKAVKYIKACRNSDGSFSYQPGNSPPKSSAVMNTSVALAALMMAQQNKNDKDIEQGLQYILRKIDKKDGQPDLTGEFYSGLAMHRAGNIYWNRWYPKIKDRVLKLQKFDGSFAAPSEYKEDFIFSTSLYSLILTIPNSSLPLFGK